MKNHIAVHCKKNPDEYPALVGLQWSLRIELDLYPADSHPDRSGEKSRSIWIIKK